MYPKLPCLFLILLSAFLGCSETPENTPSIEKNSRTENVALEAEPGSPVSVLRTFMKAMLTSDAHTLMAVCVPHPELELLYTGERPPKDVIDHMFNEFKNMPVKTLSVGESFTLPSGKTMLIDETMVTKDRVQLTAPGNPFPFDIQRIEGQWKVNPTMVISIRRAARKLSRENGKD